DRFAGPPDRVEPAKPLQFGPPCCDEMGHRRPSTPRRSWLRTEREAWLNQRFGTSCLHLHLLRGVSQAKQSALAWCDLEEQVLRDLVLIDRIDLVEPDAVRESCLAIKR